MAEGDGVVYNAFKEALMMGTHALETDVIKVALVGSSYTPNIDTHTAFTTHITNECAGTGYTAGGATVASAAVTLDTANDLGNLDATDPTWTSLGPLTPQPAYAILYNSTDDALICYWEVTTLTNGGNYTLNFSSSPAAILQIT